MPEGGLQRATAYATVSKKVFSCVPSSPTFYLFVATPQGVWDPSSLSTDRTWALSSESTCPNRWATRESSQSHTLIIYLLLTDLLQAAFITQP